MQLPEINITDAARALLKPGEVFILGWQRAPMCCATGGEVLLYVTKESVAAKKRSLFVPKGTQNIYVAREVYVHLVGRSVTISGKKRFGVRWFRTDLPSDFGLRASMGRLPEPERTATN